MSLKITISGLQLYPPGQCPWEKIFTVSSPCAHGELTVTTMVTAPGPMITAQSQLGEVTAQSRRGHSSVTARSQLSHGEVTAQSRHLQYDHGSVTARSQLNHGPGHGSVTAGCDHFGHGELTVRSPWGHGELTVSSRWPFFFSHGWVNLTLWRWTEKWIMGQNEDNDITTLASLWLRHQTETNSALLGLCEGNPPMTSHKGQLCGTLTFSLICAWTNGWAINREAGDSRSLWRYCNERGSNAWLWCFLFVILMGCWTNSPGAGDLKRHNIHVRRCGGVETASTST